MLIKETETETSNSEVTAPDGVVSENLITQLDHRTRQRMTPKPPMKLLSPKSSVKIGQWNIRTMYEAGKCTQVIAEMRRYNISILGISEMRWNTCGRMTTGTGEMVAELDEQGTTWAAAKKIAQNRTRWKVTVNGLCSARNSED